MAELAQASFETPRGFPVPSQGLHLPSACSTEPNEGGEHGESGDAGAGSSPAGGSPACSTRGHAATAVSA
eukprot:CAMPEP_0176244626 /NCGR_PEP_ID=MMETSP0121_2-20121125/31526_1 /TAXON_ID=160619 /ORGANISM="Kryptoperidinium foliaceum, Strain CCMP 1326" /LENGTH=69 /DNA_ID=CAMNT_0017584235 /DNA_START=184 /DNA_END=390 /DNA_ORIENTATION=-